MLSYSAEIYKLTHEFYEICASGKSELLQKENRAYNCLLVDLHTNYFICIPYRTNMTHNFGYHFQSSKRCIHNKSGLDYTKMVIVSELSFLDSNVTIDFDEYKETITHLDRIVRGAIAYLDGYINHVKKINLLPSARFERKYGKSTLVYFHKELGI